MDSRFATIRSVREQRPTLAHSGFVTPLATLSASAVEHNIGQMERFVRQHGVKIAPHGKTTMAPQIFERQLRAGAWGISVATPWQAMVCRRFGVSRILLANELTDPAAIAWLVGELRGDLEFLSYVDDPLQVARSDDVMARLGATRPLDVLIEVGHEGGRTGCRDKAQVEKVASAISESRYHRLVGIAGYEGTVGSPLAAETVARVRAYLRRMRETAESLCATGAISDEVGVILTAGGSAHFDLVVEHLAGAFPDGRRAEVIIRSGAYVTHDDGLYAAVSPFGREVVRKEEEGLKPAITVWTRVLSRPEAELVYVDAGRRDLPLDSGMPTVSSLCRGGVVESAPVGWRMTAAQDQHGYLSIPADADAAPGDLVGLGISHPCTLFDKWSWLPLVDDAGHVTDVVRTYF